MGGEEPRSLLLLTWIICGQEYLGAGDRNCDCVFSVRTRFEFDGRYLRGVLLYPTVCLCSGGIRLAFGVLLYPTVSSRTTIILLPETTSCLIPGETQSCELQSVSIRVGPGKLLAERQVLVGDAKSREKQYSNRGFIE
ncbi:hypothetical protein BDV95DRAFT_324492 [Massariosphaeria phaeospora]|uniref:Uncharacterized protein n=1 Tax=Massariosphaeria phaeospora TaxID=100035 RepID=A0A7C8IJ68_9PLEO|nr:hypothetical protein BDV95DRAFT_324492 [Massariosphaeria phaeospora]